MITKTPKRLTDRFRPPALRPVISGRIASAVLMWVDSEFMVALIGSTSQTPDAIEIDGEQLPTKWNPAQDVAGFSHQPLRAVFVVHIGFQIQSLKLLAAHDGQAPLQGHLVQAAPDLTDGPGFFLRAKPPPVPHDGPLRKH